MGILAGIVKFLEYLFRDLIDRKDFESRLNGLCQKAHYFNILRHLYEHPADRHKIIAQREGISYSYLTEIMKELQYAHAVDKYYQGKAALYELTEEGKNYMAAALGSHSDKTAPDYLGKYPLWRLEKDDDPMESHLSKMNADTLNKIHKKKDSIFKTKYQEKIA